MQQVSKLGVTFTTGSAPVPSTDEDEVDFTIVIAHRGPALGLWATIHSCEIELTGTKYKYNYVIVPNGQEKWVDSDRVWYFLTQTGKMRDLINVAAPLSPPTARQLGSDSANGKYIFFLDNHCLVDRGYFDSAIQTMEKNPQIGLLHSLTRFYSGEKDHWHYVLRLESNFWGGNVMSPPGEPLYTEPTRIALAGHGGFAVRRKTWKEVGGYWTGFTGYGGEESYMDLKMWLLGHEVWLDPHMIHYHYAGERGYARHYTDDYYRNMLMAANVIGGREWMYKVYNNFLKSVRGKSDVNMFDILEQAQTKSAQYAALLQPRFIRTLDKQLQYFIEHNIWTK